MNKDSLLKTAIKAAIDAGNDILNIYENEDFEINYKKDESPLTVADRVSHNKIISYLEKTNIPILSEEGKDIAYEERKKWKEFWLVDPLDGTKEFIKRNGEFTVNIALIKNQIAVMGVIYVPFSGEIYFGDNKNGAFKSEISVGENPDFNKIIESSVLLPKKENRKTYVVVGSRSHFSDETKQFVDDLKKKHSKIDIISKGSSLKICMVAEGKADIYPRLGPTMEWDTAAGHAILSAVGGEIMIYKQDKKLLYNKEDLVNPFFVVSLNNF